MSPRVGASAPDLTLRDQHGQAVSLADFRGSEHVALVFFPFAFSGLCTDDPVYSLRAFADAQGYEFPLLSDFWPHGEVARAYDVFDEVRGRAGRGTFLIDTDGMLRWSVVNAPGQPRPLAAYREAIAALAA
jgi:peroxiredoxin (alkyl hydroperoxide reductase subunit C)